MKKKNESKVGSAVKKLIGEDDFSSHAYFGKPGPAKALKIYREKNELTQLELAELTGLKQATISSMESGRINIGVERAKLLATALKVHPSAIVFAGWTAEESAA